MSIQLTYADKTAVGFAGMLADGGSHDIMAMRQAEATAEIGFGYGVCFDPSAPVTDQDVQLPAAQTNKVAGIVVHSHAYDLEYTLMGGAKAGELGATGLKPGAMLSVLRRGRIWARCEDGCVPGDRLFVRCTVGSPAAVEFLGSLNNAVEGTETIDATKQGVWLTTAAAEGLAVLEVDFTAAP